jgi:hypothetical protein
VVAVVVLMPVSSDSGGSGVGGGNSRGGGSHSVRDGHHVEIRHCVILIPECLVESHSECLPAALRTEGDVRARGEWSGVDVRFLPLPRE